MRRARGAHAVVVTDYWRIWWVAEPSAIVAKTDYRCGEPWPSPVLVVSSTQRTLCFLLLGGRAVLP